MEERYVIYKYVLGIAHRYVVNMPDTAKIIKVGVQDDKICLWAIVPKGEVAFPKEFIIVGTGMILPEDIGDYVGTVQKKGFDDMEFVWHVFKKQN
jgi:hypothetical protein